MRKTNGMNFSHVSFVMFESTHPNKIYFQNQKHM